MRVPVTLTDVVPEVPATGVITIFTFAPVYVKSISTRFAETKTSPYVVIYTSVPFVITSTLVISMFVEFVALIMNSPPLYVPEAYTVLSVSAVVPVVLPEAFTIAEFPVPKVGVPLIAGLVKVLFVRVSDDETVTTFTPSMLTTPAETLAIVVSVA